MRHGRRHADLEFRTSLHGPEASAPLERVEFDFTPANMLIDADIGLPMGGAPPRQQSTAFPLCLAVEVFLDSPNAANALTTLRQAIPPKIWFKEQYPDVKYDWPCCGVPALIAFDN